MSEKETEGPSKAYTMDDSQRALSDAAITAAEKAYAPYSNFKVGSALKTKEGEVFCGCNVENASYGLAICAERNAITTAVANGHQEFESIAIASKGAVSPCGACRQFIAEFGLDTRVVMVDSESGEVRRTCTAGDLLPDSFSLLD